MAERRHAAVPTHDCKQPPASGFSRDAMASRLYGKDGMPNGLSAVLSSDAIEALARGAVADLQADCCDTGLQKLAPLRKGRFDLLMRD
ncbi:hypothetical protein ACRAVF_14850 [Bradyrhizobium oligotrophicum S58]